LPATRTDSGVVVLAQTAGGSGLETGLEPGDIIRAINHSPVQSGAQLQSRVHEIKSGDPVVLQIERNGKLQYLAFEME
jgi:serine protease Do